MQSTPSPWGQQFVPDAEAPAGATTRETDTMIDLDNLKHHLLAGTRIDPDCIPESGPVILPKDMTLADLEPYMSAPARHRGVYRTEWPSEFIRYAVENANQEDYPQCFMESCGTAAPRATLLFDFGTHDTPQWREHRAELAICESEAFAALIDLIGRNLTQEDLLRFIDDWSGNCDFERPDGSLVNPAVARTEFADLSVDQIKNLRSKQADFARERSAVERISMGSGLPNRLHFTCEPWTGLGTKRVTVRIAAADNAGALALRMSLIGWPIVRQELICELVELLSGAPVTVRRGTFEPGLRPVSA